MVMVSALGMLSRMYDVIGIPEVPSFMPLAITPYSDEMTFMERLRNFKISVQLRYFIQQWEQEFWKLFNSKYPGFPSIQHIYLEKTALIMINVNEFAETPRPTVNMVRYVGGSTLHDSQPLSEELDRLLNEREANVLFSLGSLAQSKDMPRRLKDDIVETFASFPNVTFIWKYEGDDILHEAHPNIYTTKWVPQTDLLDDRRLSLFITHGGMNSMLEAMFHGVPMVVIPLFGDQQLNSRNIQRRGIGTLVERNKLNKKTLTAAIKKTLNNKKISREATFVASLLAGRPQQYRDDISKWAKIIIEHGLLSAFTSMYVLIVICALVAAISVKASNILVWNPTIAHSHINFMGRVADALSADGHNVVCIFLGVLSVCHRNCRHSCQVCHFSLMRGIILPKYLLQTIFSPSIEADKTYFGNQLPAQTVRYVPRKAGDGYLKEFMKTSIWEAPPCSGVCFDWHAFDMMNDLTLRYCKDLLDDEIMLDRLKRSKFELAFIEVLDVCAPGIIEFFLCITDFLLQILDIKNIILPSGCHMLPQLYEVAGIVGLPSFVPGVVTPYSDDMTFIERFRNFITSLQFKLFIERWNHKFWKLFNAKYPGFPTIKEIYLEKTSLIMVNVNEFAESPRPRTNMIRYIGGAAQPEPKPLSKLFLCTTDFLLQILDIKNIILPSGCHMLPQLYEVAGIVGLPSFVPGVITPYSDDMTFIERFRNFITSLQFKLFIDRWNHKFWKLFNAKYPGFPTTREIYFEKTSLIMVNANEFAESPRPRTNMIRYIGGAAQPDPKPLSKVKRVQGTLTKA
ncbi:glycosyltransferase family 28 protein [Oesophagostomum dentatum]|uniref:glucuronosyltransferase n=1 Tax=Oesophagostomum dentatum TaxID=61180 RepID=A0A0B1SWV7_OESDE|nr:glycosyltransferase family 28 protein [Oesophagostomum dentatum]